MAKKRKKKPEIEEKRNYRNVINKCTLMTTFMKALQEMKSKERDDSKQPK